MWCDVMIVMKSNEKAKDLKSIDTQLFELLKSLLGELTGSLKMFDQAEKVMKQLVKISLGQNE